MTMKRKISYKIVLLFCLLSYFQGGFGQQLPLYTQYIFNSFVINPALAGTHNYYQIRTNTRVQWAGIPDHPITNYLSVYGPDKNMDMGYGCYVFNDVTGPTSKFGISGAYAYNIAIQEGMRLSMGLSFGIMQYKVDGTNIDLAQPGDVLNGSVYSKVVPDAGIGLYLYTFNYHVGFSTNQILNNKVKLLEVENTDAVSRLRSHFYLTGGYRYYINKEWALEPNMALKAVGAAPVQMDITVKGIYDAMIWGALAYRTGDAISLLLGYIHQGQYFFGYSYDFTAFSDIRKHSVGSHEITIGYRFNEIK
jgi:type IX secretion system PorP/SprF family membrane protein